jgi:hypothetical protein
MSKEDKEYRVFEGKTLQEAMNRLLKAGFRPLTLKETFDYRKRTGQKGEWFDTATCYDGNGNIREAVLKELKNLKGFYSKGGRLLFLGDYVIIGLDGCLYDDARFVGVKNRQRRSKEQDSIPLEQWQEALKYSAVRLIEEHNRKVALLREWLDDLRTSNDLWRMDNTELHIAFEDKIDEVFGEPKEKDKRERR